MVGNIKRYSAYQDGHWFTSMHLAGEAREICCVSTRRMRATTVGTWTKWWSNWGKHSATDSLCHYRNTDISFVRSFEEVVYERCIADILGPLQATPFQRGLVIG